MDALVALGDHGPDAEECRAFRGPVARRARAVLLAREHDQRRAGGLVLHRRVVDRQLLARRQVDRPVAFGARRELVLETDVRERAAHHDLVIAAPRTVTVEVLLLHAEAHEVLLHRFGTARSQREVVLGAPA